MPDTMIFAKFNENKRKTMFKKEIDLSNCIKKIHCVKSVRIWSYSGPDFPAFGSVRMQKNADQNNSEYEHFMQW